MHGRGWIIVLSFAILFLLCLAIISCCENGHKIATEKLALDEEAYIIDRVPRKSSICYYCMGCHERDKCSSVTGCAIISSKIIIVIVFVGIVLASLAYILGYAACMVLEDFACVYNEASSDFERYAPIGGLCLCGVMGFILCILHCLEPISRCSTALKTRYNESRKKAAVNHQAKNNVQLLSV